MIANQWFDFLVGPALMRAELSRKALQRVKRALRRQRFSANLIVDLGGAAQLGVTLPPTVGSVGSGGYVDSFRSGVLIGASVDMLHSDTFCNLVAAGVGVASGPLILQVQTSDADTSGTYTDPTSGLSQFPTSFQSGGLLYIGLSGSAASGLGLLNSGFVSGQALLSGFAVAAGFQRPTRYARANVLSGFYQGSLQALFVSQIKTTGSGGGFTLSPSSGAVSV